MKKMLVMASAAVMTLAMISCGGNGSIKGNNPKADVDKFLKKACSCGEITDETKAKACFEEAYKMMKQLEEKYDDNEEAEKIMQDAIDNCECQDAILGIAFMSLADQMD